MATQGTARQDERSCPPAVTYANNSCTEPSTRLPPVAVAAESEVVAATTAFCKALLLGAGATQPSSATASTVAGARLTDAFPHPPTIVTAAAVAGATPSAAKRAPHKRPSMDEYAPHAWLLHFLAVRGLRTAAAAATTTLSTVMPSAPAALTLSQTLDAVSGGFLPTVPSAATHRAPPQPQPHAEQRQRRDHFGALDATLTSTYLALEAYCYCSSDVPASNHPSSRAQPWMAATSADSTRSSGTATDPALSAVGPFISSPCHASDGAPRPPLLPGGCLVGGLRREIVRFVSGCWCPAQGVFSATLCAGSLQGGPRAATATSHSPAVGPGGGSRTDMPCMGGCPVPPTECDPRQTYSAVMALWRLHCYDGTRAAIEKEPSVGPFCEALRGAEDTALACLRTFRAWWDSRSSPLHDRCNNNADASNGAGDSSWPLPTRTAVVASLLRALVPHEGGFGSPMPPAPRQDRPPPPPPPHGLSKRGAAFGPPVEAHLGMTYCAVTALVALGYFDEPNEARIVATPPDDDRGGYGCGGEATHQPSSDRAAANRVAVPPVEEAAAVEAGVLRYVTARQDHFGLAITDDSSSPTTRFSSEGTTASGDDNLTSLQHNQAALQQAFAFRGMQGRPNKDADTCYSFWARGTLRALAVARQMRRRSVGKSGGASALGSGARLTDTFLRGPAATIDGNSGGNGGADVGCSAGTLWPAELLDDDALRAFTTMTTVAGGGCTHRASKACRHGPVAKAPTVDPDPVHAVLGLAGFCPPNAALLGPPGSHPLYPFP